MYFDQPGKVNTENTLSLAYERGRPDFFDMRIREIICKPRTF